MLQADGIVYFYLFLFIIRCVTPETHDKRCVREGKTGEEKGNCSDSASLRRAGEILARPGGIQSGSLICLKHRNEMIRNDKRCSCPSSWGHSQKLAKTPIPNCLYQVFDRLENLFQTTNLGQTDALNAKSRRTKNSTSTENAYREKKRPATSRIRRLNNF